MAQMRNTDLNSQVEPVPPAKPNAEDKRKRKASDASIIKKLPELVRSALNRDQAFFVSLSHELLNATEETHPSVHGQLKRILKFHNPAVAVPVLKQTLAKCEAPTVTLDEVVLDDHLTADVRELLFEHQRQESLQAFGLSPRHKILLSGPEGNGKTILAEALADALELPFMQVKLSGLIDSHLGETGKRIDELFTYAASQPMVMFIDEFDSIASVRGGNSMEVGEAARITNQLLITMNTLPPHVVLVAATNKLDAIDKAARRRFDCEMVLGKPSLATREKLAQKELASDLTPGVDLSKWASEVAALELENLNAVALLCRRIRRDQALYQGRGIQNIISRA